MPHTWSVAPFNGGWTSSLFASQDPVAIESVLFDLFQLDPDPYQYPKIAGAEDYLVEAAQANNPPSGTFYDPNHEIATERYKALASSSIGTIQLTESIPGTLELETASSHFYRRSINQYSLRWPIFHRIVRLPLGRRGEDVHGRDFYLENKIG